MASGFGALGRWRPHPLRDAVASFDCHRARCAEFAYRRHERTTIRPARSDTVGTGTPHESPLKTAMDRTFHFIAGLPRSGSTLLAAILRQNPCIRAGVQSPVSPMVKALIKAASVSEHAVFVSDEQRLRLIGAIFTGYYDSSTSERIVFDSNRAWCGLMDVLAKILPASRVVCCVRSPAWILDSFERRVQARQTVFPKMFEHDSNNTVYERVDAMMKGVVGQSIRSFRQAWFGEHAHKLIVVRYDSLVADPARVLRELYLGIAEPCFRHAFEQVEYDSPELDFVVGLPDLHKVTGPVQARPRTTILPPEIFAQFDNEFWNGGGENPRGVQVL